MTSYLTLLNNIWQIIPAWKNVTENDFRNDRWQLRNSITQAKELAELIGPITDSEFIRDVYEGQNRSPMNMRVTPYILALIDWHSPYEDPLRKQFIPVASEYLSDHPNYLVDSLAEDIDSPTPQIVHRYPDKVLFLPVTACPVYCSFCTRSRMVGGTTNTRTKIFYGATPSKWEMAFNYLRANPMIEDVVISGGDAYQIPSRHIETIGQSLLSIPNIKRIRFGTKGLAVLPMKILSDDQWVNALSNVKKMAHDLGKQIFIHTHFNHPNEITHYTEEAMQHLNSLNFYVRNQSVLLAGVNNSLKTMGNLIKKLISINIEPYYIYIHDMVGSCEHLRTTLREAIELSKAIQGLTAGYFTPRVVCDLPGGGGKRLITSYESYDEILGISVWQSPTVKPGKNFYYYDPIHKLSKEAQKEWSRLLLKSTSFKK